MGIRDILEKCICPLFPSGRHEDNRSDVEMICDSIENEHDDWAATFDMGVWFYKINRAVQKETIHSVAYSDICFSLDFRRHREGERIYCTLGRFTPQESQKIMSSINKWKKVEEDRARAVLRTRVKEIFKRPTCIAGTVVGG